MFIFFVVFALFYGLYYYFSYQVILLNDLEQIFSQTASKAQHDLKQYNDLILEDLGRCYQNVLVIILVAALVSFIWILLLKYNAKVIIWLSMFSLPIILSVGLYYSTTTYIQLHNKSSPTDDDSANININDQENLLNSANQKQEFEHALQNILTAELMSYVHNETLWLVISIVLFLILMILLIILSALRDRVRLSIALIRQASKAINGVKSTLIFPIIPRTIAIAALVYGIMISLLIISASHSSYQIDSGPNKGVPCNPRLSRLNSTSNALPRAGSIKRPECVAIQNLSRQHVWKYHLLNLFATLWIVHFISGISQTTLAGAFASYYWNYRRPPFFAVSSSLYRVIRFHLGDIAFGSFLIATIRYIRIIIEFIDNRIRSKSRLNSPNIELGVSNSNARSMTCFFRVFFWLLDKFLRYIDRNAYIIMSMYGKGYLQSAKIAVKLIYENPARAVVLDYVTYFVLLVSRLLITIAAGFVTAQEVFTSNLHYKWLPIVLVVIGTHFIAKGLFSVYSMAVDTLFICFLIDSKDNDGSAERPYVMSKDLRKIIKRNTIVS